MAGKLAVHVVEKRGPRGRRSGFGDLERGIELGAQLVVDGPATGRVQGALRFE